MIKLPNSCSLGIEQHILARFRGFRQTLINPFESGGILMGRKIGRLFVIDFTSTPGEGDLREHNGFIRNKERAQTIINREKQKSGGRRIYLGEWHTHNQPTPCPSLLDLEEWELTFKSSKLSIGFMFCVIVGSKDKLFNIHLSMQSKKGNCEIVFK